MASILSAARDEIYPLVKTNFSVTTIMEAATADRANVRFLIEQSEEAAATISQGLPYCVVAWGPQMPANYACNGDEYEQEVTVYYLRSTRSGGSPVKARIINTDLEDKLRAFVDAMRGSTSAFQTIECSTDISNANEANSYFLRNNLPIFAGIARIKILVGESIN